MTVQELDELIEELHGRIGPTLEYSPDPIAAEFLGRVLNALREYSEIRHVIRESAHLAVDRP